MEIAKHIQSEQNKLLLYELKRLQEESQQWFNVKMSVFVNSPHQTTFVQEIMVERGAVKRKTNAC